MSQELQDKPDYQKTLNLPQTDFSMKANLAQREPTFLQKWEKENLYAEIRKKCHGKKEFTLHDGPPYANGNIHIGHALNKTLKDFILKYQTMQDKDVLYVPGWDCHGLPIEHALLKDMNKHKSEVDCVPFRKKAHEYALKYVGIQKEQFKRLGIFGEWDNPYLTLTPLYEYWILKSLGNLNQNGYIYHGLKPVNWCASCETALAEAEVEYENHTSASVYVKFKVENPQVISGLPNKPLSLLIWTTTPWTLLANVAVAVSSQFQYSLVDLGEDVVIVESSLASRVLEKAGIKDFKVIKEVAGKDLVNLKYAHPFGIKTNCCVVTAAYVTKEDGTGLVHTAPGHGQDDFQTGLKYKLDVLVPVNDRGVYTKDAGPYEGQYVFKANEKIIEDLQSKGVLLARENINHQYPHCWRCKKPIIFRATRQWFLNVEHNNLRERLKQVITDEVRWVPEAGRERILGMVSTRPDWCLSRQRFWGVPIPAIICKNCGTHVLSTDVIEKFAEVVKEKGTDSWFELDLNVFLSGKEKCASCGGHEFSKGSDILDVWFDSGVSHQAVVKGMMGKKLPADLYLEGSDQHRGWFQSSLIPGVAIEGHAPYKSVLTHGFVVDGQGRKMSKSMGNVVSPLDVIKNSGADILRLWIASSSYNEDIRISDEILARIVDAYRKIRNTFRYLLGNLHGFNPDEDMVEYEKLPLLDQWALMRLSQVADEMKAAYDGFQFAEVYKILYAFCNEDLSSFYLDILKDRLYISPTKSLARRSAQTVLFYMTDYLTRAMAPIFVFTAEEIFLSMPKGKNLKNLPSVHLLNWPSIPKVWTREAKHIQDQFDLLIKIRPFVLKALEDKRRIGAIGSSLEAKIIFKTSSDVHYTYLNNHKSFLPEAFIVSQVSIEKFEKIEQGLNDGLPQVAIEVERAEGEKCSRCWNYFTDLGSDPSHPTLCKRCTTVVKEFV